jgi:hypothetical protein
LFTVYGGEISRVLASFGNPVEINIEWKFYAFFYFIRPNQEQLRKYATIGTLAGIEPDSIYLYLIVYVNATTRQHAWYNPWTTYTHISQARASYRLS